MEGHGQKFKVELHENKLKLETRMFRSQSKTETSLKTSTVHVQKGIVLIYHQLT